MMGRRHAFPFALILLLVPLVHSQTQSSTLILQGTVAETTLLSSGDLHVWLQGEQAGLEVCLGPERFLEDHALLPSVGDAIEVTGTRVGNGSLLIATSLQMGSKSLGLRATPATRGCWGCDGHGCGHHSCGSRGDQCDHHRYGNCCGH
jgi:hypothetical protein